MKCSLCSLEIGFSHGTFPHPVVLWFFFCCHNRCKEELHILEMVLPPPVEAR